MSVHPLSVYPLPLKIYAKSSNTSSMHSGFYWKREISVALSFKGLKELEDGQIKLACCEWKSSKDKEGEEKGSKEIITDRRRQSGWAKTILGSS